MRNNEDIIDFIRSVIDEDINDIPSDQLDFLQLLANSEGASSSNIFFGICALIGEAVVFVLLFRNLASGRLCLDISVSFCEIMLYFE